MLSKNIARNELDNFRQTVNKILLQSLFLALPVTVIILVQRLAIVRLLFGSHEFPWSATLTTARILAFLTPAIVCQAIIQILIRAFYALHNTKIPFKVSFLSLFTNVFTSFILVNYTNLGVVGLAISSSIGNITQLLGLFYFFIKIVDGFDWVKTLKKVNQMLFASLIMGLTTWLSLKFLDLFILDTTRVLPLVIVFSLSTIIGILVYFFTAYKFHVEELEDYQKFFLKLQYFLNRIFRKIFNLN